MDTKFSEINESYSQKTKKKIVRGEINIQGLRFQLTK